MKQLFLLLPVLVLWGCSPEPTTYRVYYHGNGSTGGNPPTDSRDYTSGESAMVLGPGNLKNNDYTFLGWRNYYDRLYNAGDYITVNYDDINFYPVWDDGSDTPFSFKIENDEVIITRYNEDFRYKSSVTIPNTLQGKPVTSIDDSVFSNSSLYSVNLSKQLRHIGVGAFASNQITQILIPDSVEAIGRGAFRNNDLRKVTLGDGLAAIEPYVFMHNSLTDIIIPENITSVGEGAFHENDIDQIKIGAGVDIKNDSALGTYGASFKAYYDQGKQAGLYLYVGADTWVR